MFAKLLLLFTIVPAVELALLIAVGRQIGTMPTLALILATGAAGAWLARREGTRAWRELRGTVAAGTMPGDALFGGAAILLGGALLLTPGIVTDLFGLLLLLPPTRAAIIRRVRRGIERRVLAARGGIEVRSWTRPSPPA